ncbi:MAG: hypothetical protein HYZ44_06980 [Bacteroidetes bacterium]|nr:hypothetical protein [Bacteroidota bacterium]
MIFRASLIACIALIFSCQSPAKEDKRLEDKPSATDIAAIRTIWLKRVNGEWVVVYDNTS